MKTLRWRNTSKVWSNAVEERAGSVIRNRVHVEKDMRSSEHVRSEPESESKARSSCMVIATGRLSFSLSVGVVSLETDLDSGVLNWKGHPSPTTGELGRKGISGQTLDFERRRFLLSCFVVIGCIIAVARARARQGRENAKNSVRETR